MHPFNALQRIALRHQAAHTAHRLLDRGELVQHVEYAGHRPQLRIEPLRQPQAIGALERRGQRRAGERGNLAGHHGVGMADELLQHVAHLDRDAVHRYPEFNSAAFLAMDDEEARRYEYRLLSVIAPERAREMSRLLRSRYVSEVLAAGSAALPDANAIQLSTACLDDPAMDAAATPTTHSDGEDVAIIGARMADTLRLGVGSVFKAISPQTSSTMMGNLPRIREFEVVGVFDVGMYEFDNAVIFIRAVSGDFPPWNLTRNAPDFRGSVLYVHDLDGLNQLLIKQYAGRQFFVYEYDETKPPILQPLVPDEAVETGG